VNDLEYTWKRDLANPLIAHYGWMSRKALNSGCSGIGFGSDHKASQGVTRRHKASQGGATGSQRVITIELTNGLTKQLATFGAATLQHLL
jgi:hypothetical protein